MMRPLLFPLSLLLLLVGCARQGYPTGGPKDTQPPQALASKPDNGSRNFGANEFYIQFDEYVVLKNPTDNILVSPPMKQQPEYTTKGKGILVKIKDTLQPNTTYLFQFKDAVADFNEGNLLPSFEYVFSTGDSMDTLMLDGRVLDPRTGKPWKETVTVAAFNSATQALGDSSAMSPSFISRCDKEGYFALHHLPEGSYRLIAFEDKNRNLRLDTVEAVAWDTAIFIAHPLPDSLSATQAAKHAVTLHISQPDKRRQRITKSEFTAKGHIMIVTQLPLQQPTIEGLETEWRLNSRNDTLTLWCLDAKLDSARFVVSDPSGIQDTLRLRYTDKTKGKRRKANEKVEKTPLMRTLCDGDKAFYDNLQLAFENPVVMRDSAQAKILYLKDSTVTHCSLALDSSGLSARLLTSLKSGEQYRIRLRDSLFTDIYGNPSDSLVFSLTPKDYGILTLHIDNRTNLPLVIEVLDKKDTVVQHLNIVGRADGTPQAIEHSNTLTFSHLPAGDYRLRAILDVNGDGHWTPGDYYLSRQPEKIIFFEKTLSLREKWEMEEQWIVGAPPRVRPQLNKLDNFDVRKTDQPTDFQKNPITPK